MIPFAHFKSGSTAVKRKIRVTLSGEPSSFTATKCKIRFDKTFILSWSMDDSYGDCSMIGIPYLKGGNVIEYSGVHANCPGKYYTDGCGNDIAFNFNLRVIGSAITNLEATGKYMNFKDFRRAYVMGCAYINHSYSHLANFSSGMSEDEATRTAQLRAQILDNYDLIRQQTGIRMSTFSFPGGNQSEYYAAVAWALYNEPNPAVQMILCFDPEYSTTSFYNRDSHLDSLESIIAKTDVGAGHDRYWDWDTPHIAGKTDAQVLALIDAKIANTTESQHWWISAGSHVLGFLNSPTSSPSLGFTYPDFKRFMDLLETYYGKPGADNMWMENDQDVWQYTRCYKYSNISVLATDVNKREIEIDFSGCSNEFRYHTLSFIINTDVNITDIDIEGYDTSSYKLNYKSLGNGVALVNVQYMPAYERALYRRLAALVGVETLEFTQLGVDKTAAQTEVNKLLKGTYRTALQARIDAVTILPGITVEVDLGSTSTTYQTSYPWSNFAFATGTVLATGTALDPLFGMDSRSTPFRLEITENTFTVKTGGSNTAGRYPASANRDYFSVAAGTYGVLTLSGLTASKKYDIKCFGNRATGSAVQKYTVNGVSQTIETGYGNLNNTCDFLNITGVTTITIRVEGSTSLIEGRLNVLEINEHD